MSKSDQPARIGLLKVLAAVLTAGAMLVVTGAAPAGATGGGSPVVASNHQGTMKAPVVFRSDEGWFRGRFAPSSFEVVGDQLLAHGTVSGLLHQKGDRTRHVSQDVTLPVQLPAQEGAGRTASGSRLAAAAGTCNVLNLVLGPLDLNLLGLEVHLDRVVLDIVANPAGGLLGQLLCAVAHLLDGGPLDDLLAQLSDLLAQILGVLGTV